MKANITTERLAKACNVWNALTCPWIALSDSQHELRRIRARKIMAWIRKHFPSCAVREYSNGMILPAR